MTTDGWEGILDADEEILWQGRPDTKMVWRVSNIFTFIFGLFFAGFALFWMIMAAASGGIMWVFGLLHFSVGIGISLGAIFFSSFKRKRSWYTLTSKRAFIATVLPLQGRRLKSYSIESDTVLEIDDKAPATIYFATELRSGQSSSHTVRIGFERIEDGRAVFVMFREVQRKAA